nr:unnamed protein product [Spirometra erinaceieuropaei]
MRNEEEEEVEEEQEGDEEEKEKEEDRGERRNKGCCQIQPQIPDVAGSPSANLELMADLQRSFHWRFSSV